MAYESNAAFLRQAKVPLGHNAREQDRNIRYRIVNDKRSGVCNFILVIRGEGGVTGEKSLHVV